MVGQVGAAKKLSSEQMALMHRGTFYLPAGSEPSVTHTLFLPHTSTHTGQGEGKGKGEGASPPPLLVTEIFISLEPLTRVISYKKWLVSEH